MSALTDYHVALWIPTDKGLPEALVTIHREMGLIRGKDFEIVPLSEKDVYREALAAAQKQAKESNAEMVVVSEDEAFCLLTSWNFDGSASVIDAHVCVIELLRGNRDCEEDS